MIRNVHVDDAGTYAVIAENEMGTSSGHVELNVKAGPVIKGKLEHYCLIDEDCKLMFEIDADPKPKVVFYKDDQQIASNKLITVVEDGIKYGLEFACAQFRNSGLYTIVATSDGMQTTEHFRFNVQAKPSIMKDLGKHIEFYPGDHVNLTVKLEAEPAPQIQW